MTIIYADLMIIGGGAHNPKELHLIDTLDGLLTQAEKGDALDTDMLSSVRYKMSRVSCFAEKYYDIFDFLERYQQRKGASTGNPRLAPVIPSFG